MDGEVRNESEPAKNYVEALTPEAKRLIELKVELGKLKHTQTTLEPIYREVAHHWHMTNGIIKELESDIDLLNQGQLLL